jgi:G:T/U-mismatch repair DNA glycosylase
MRNYDVVYFSETKWFLFNIFELQIFLIKMKETHSWVKFPKNSTNSRKFILGSFPPNKFNTHKQLKTNCDMDFFYGSKDNFFWKLFSDALNLNYKFPDDLQNLKEYLVKNGWAVSDIVLECKRQKNTAADQDLKVIKWNQSIINDIIDNNSIKSIYYTSKWVKEKFDRYINFDKKTANINEYILPSPSRNGLRSIGSATFLDYPKEHNETATNFRLRYYRDILNR